MLRVAGLDVGDKTIGVAVSDPLGWTAQGIATLRRTKLAADLTALRDLLAPFNVGRLVVGLPRNMNGTYGPRADQARAFGRNAGAALGLAVAYWDERLSTAAAERVLIAADASRARRRQVIDKLAAVLILQAYLDARRPSVALDPEQP